MNDNDYFLYSDFTTLTRKEQHSFIAYMKFLGMGVSFWDARIIDCPIIVLDFSGGVRTLLGTTADDDYVNDRIHLSDLKRMAALGELVNA